MTTMNKLYDDDFFGWTQHQADALRRRSANELDWDNLLEEIEGLGQSAENELINRLAVLLGHLLKWHLQPAKRTRSWVLTVREQRRRIRRLLDRNPSLKPALDDALAEGYRSGVNMAANETGLPDTAFAPTSPFSFEDAMGGRIEWDQD